MPAPAPIDWPLAIGPISSSWQLNRAGAVAQPVSGAYDATDYGWGLHRCTAEFQAAGRGTNTYAFFELEALVHRLAGGLQPIMVPKWDRGLGPRGGITLPRPAVQGGAQLGHSIQIDGVSGTNPILRTGDFISINFQLYCVRADVNHSGGVATLVLDPPVSKSPPDNALVGFAGYAQAGMDHTARCAMVLVSPAAAAYRAPATGRISLEFQEIFY